MQDIGPPPSHVNQTSKTVSPSAGNGEGTLPATNIAITPSCPQQADAASNIKAIGDLASGVASLMWPLVALTLFIVFRRQVVRLISRVRRGKIGPAEFELEAVVEELGDKITEAKVEAEEPSGSAPPSELHDAPAKTFELPRDKHRVVKAEGSADLSLDDLSLDDLLAAAEDSENSSQLFSEVQTVLKYSPKAALVLLASSIEAKVRQVVKTTVGRDAVSASIRRNLKCLEDNNVISRELTDAAGLFWKTRNVVLHAQGYVSKSTVREAIRGGFDVLLLLTKIQGKALERFAEKYPNPPPPEAQIP
jgi:hypothetical protein